MAWLTLNNFGTVRNSSLLLSLWSHSGDFSFPSGIKIGIHTLQQWRIPPLFRTASFVWNIKFSVIAWEHRVEAKHRWEAAWVTSTRNWMASFVSACAQSFLKLYKNYGTVRYSKSTCHHRLLQKRLRRNETFVKWHNEVYGIFAVKLRRRLARWDHPRRWSLTLYRLVIVPILCAKRSWATEKSIFWNSVFHSLSLCWAPYYPGSGASMAACADLSCFAGNVVRYWMLNDYRHHTMLMLSKFSL